MAFTILPGHKVRPIDPRREGIVRAAMPGTAVALGAPEREVVDQAIRSCCAHRAWRLHALNVRNNHVHVVASADARPEIVTGTLKAWSTRRLREGGYFDSTATVWTRHGSTRYLWKASDVSAAVDYVEVGQDVGR